MATNSRKKSSALTLIASELMEFRKTNEAIGLRIREGRLSLLGRKIVNVFMYNAQQMKVPGMNAPVISEANKHYFWMPFSDLARDAAYDSNDTEHFKQVVEELQDIKLNSEDAHQWTSERMVASVKLVNTAGLKKRGGVLWVGFAFPPEVFEQVMNPETYTKLSIVYQGLLRSGSSLALYEICRRYATNPSHLTGTEPVDYWYSALTGSPAHEKPPEYKYFKRDVLKTSIAEINMVTDIDVELIEHKRGRTVQSLQFKVYLSRQPNLEFPAPPVINTQLMADLEKYGFSRQDASDLTAVYPEDKLRASMAIVDARMNAPSQSKLDSPAAYFRWHLKQGGFKAKELATEALKPAAANTQTVSLIERFLTARAREAMEVYKGYNDEQSKSLLARFKESPSGKGIRLEKGVDSVIGRSLFGRWYAEELWGPPTAEALSSFEGEITIEQQVESRKAKR